MNREEMIENYIEGTNAKENGCDIGNGRYIVIEKFSGETIWAFDCETLQECADEISQSDTDREDVFIVDTQAGSGVDPELTVILQVTRIMGQGVDFNAEVTR